MQVRLLVNQFRFRYKVCPNLNLNLNLSSFASSSDSWCLVYFILLQIGSGAFLLDQYPFEETMSSEEILIEEVGEELEYEDSCTSDSTALSSSASSASITPPIQRRTSRTWKYFKVNRDGSCAQCTLCITTVSVGGSVGNLMCHLQHKHKMEWDIIQAPATDVSCSSKKELVQRPLKSYFRSLSPTQRTAGDAALTEWICEDMQSLRVVENARFRKYVGILCPGYCPPTRRMLSERHIPELYSRLKQKLSDVLSSALAVALTCDLWTSRSNESYKTITSHFFTSNSWRLHSAVLQTSPMYGRHTAENISEVLQNAVREYKLPVVSAIVTDNARDMVNVVSVSGFTSITCAAHTLQLSVRKILQDKNIDAVIGKCRNLVSHFHRSSQKRLHWIAYFGPTVGLQRNLCRT